MRTFISKAWFWNFQWEQTTCGVNLKRVGGNWDVFSMKYFKNWFGLLIRILSLSIKSTVKNVEVRMSIELKYTSSSSSSSSSIGTTAHCGLWPVEKCPSIFFYLPPTHSIFSLPALEDLFLLPLSIFSWVFPFFSSLPVLEWRSFWSSYPPPFSLGDLSSLSFALLSTLLYCSSLLVLDSSDFSIPRFHI